MLKQAIWPYCVTISDVKSLFNGLDSCQGPYTTQRAQPEAKTLEYTIKYDAWFCCVMMHFIRMTSKVATDYADINGS